MIKNTAELLLRMVAVARVIEGLVQIVPYSCDMFKLEIQV